MHQRGKQQNCEPQVVWVAKAKRKEVATSRLCLLVIFPIAFPARETLIKLSISRPVVVQKKIKPVMKNSYPLPDSILGFLTRNWAGLCGVHRVGLSQGLVGVIWAPDFGVFVISPVQWPSGLVQNVWWFWPAAIGHLLHIQCTWFYFTSKKDK